METMLEVKNVYKRFGGLQALDNVSLRVEKGKIFGLIGPNGAGKTTLFNIIAGAYPASQGDVVFLDRKINNLGADKRCKAGIARTFQITKPFGGLSVLENVCIGALFGRNASTPLLSKSALKQSEERSMEILQFMKLDHKRKALASTLNVPERKRLELCRALATEPQLLLLDEVIAGLNPSEVGGMVELIQQINKVRGVTILMIEHIMKAVMSVSDDISVLNFGKIIAHGTPAEIVQNEDVVNAYLGSRGGK